MSSSISNDATNARTGWNEWRVGLITYHFSLCRNDKLHERMGFNSWYEKGLSDIFLHENEQLHVTNEHARETKINFLGAFWWCAFIYQWLLINLTICKMTNDRINVVISKRFVAKLSPSHSQLVDWILHEIEIFSWQKYLAVKWCFGEFDSLRIAHLRLRTKFSELWYD